MVKTIGRWTFWNLITKNSFKLLGLLSVATGLSACGSQGFLMLESASQIEEDLQSVRSEI
jgi:hypothetical protein